MRRTSLLLALLLPAVGLLACGDEVASPEPFGVLSGVVYDETGEPLPGANVNFLFHIDMIPAGSAGLAIPLTIERGTGTVDIFTHLGERVRTIAFNLDSPTLNWDGTDDEGNPVPTGIYRYLLTVFHETDEVPQTTENWLVLQVNGSRQPDTWIAHTNPDGTFRIRLDRFPLWEDYGITATSPDTEYRLSQTITLFAFRPGVENPHAEMEITLDDPTESPEVELHFPATAP